MQRFLPRHALINGQDPFEPIIRLLRGVTRNRGRLSLYAIPLFIWFSSRLFGSVRTSLNTVFHASLPPTRRHALLVFLFGKLRDAGMVIITVVLFAVSTAFTALLRVLEGQGAALAPNLSFFFTRLGRFLTGFLSLMLGLSLFLLVYKYATARQLRWRTAWLAAGFTAVGFELGKRFFALYLQYATSVDRLSPDTSTAAMIIFVIWVYYTALVFLYGGVIAETWETGKAGGSG